MYLFIYRELCVSSTSWLVLDFLRLQLLLISLLFELILTAFNIVTLFLKPFNENT